MAWIEKAIRLDRERRQRSRPQLNICLSLEFRNMAVLV
jgi:hypothetical protein